MDLRTNTIKFSLSQWFLTFNLLLFYDNSVLWAEVFIICYIIHITCPAIPDLPLDIVMSLEPIILYVKLELLIPVCVTLRLLTLNFIDRFVTQQFVS